jgi:hypothetical protein
VENVLNSAVGWPHAGRVHNRSYRTVSRGEFKQRFNRARVCQVHVIRCRARPAVAALHLSAVSAVRDDDLMRLAQFARYRTSDVTRTHYDRDAILTRLVQTLF